MTTEEVLSNYSDLTLNFFSYYKNTFVYEGQHNGEKLNLSLTPSDSYRLELAAKETLRSLVSEGEAYLTITKGNKVTTYAL